MRYRFGNFVLDAETRELWRGRHLVALNGKPIVFLIALVERAGTLVTRNELRQRLWADTFVDFDQNLNAAARRLRAALAESAGDPRWIETLPGRGYRFTAEVTPEIEVTAAPASPASPASPAPWRCSSSSPPCRCCRSAGRRRCGWRSSPRGRSTAGRP